MPFSFKGNLVGHLQNFPFSWTMTVDPKFEGLPWIAYDEPDVYETDDLPEADQRESKANDVEQVLPKEIEMTSLSANEARKRFENCRVDATSVDFSDRITGNEKVGYAVDSSEYESNPGGTRESTLTARFQRLQAEVRELLDDAETIEKETGASTTSGDLTVKQISELASSLTNQLNQLQLEKIFGPDVDLTDLCAQDAVVQRRLFEQIANFKPKQSTQKDGSAGDRITIDLYSKPSDKVDAVNEKTLELDRRLQRLEALVGSREVAPVGSPGGLLETAGRLSERVALLQPNHLEKVEERIATLQTKLAAITRSPESAVIADADTQNKIAELFEIVKKWNCFSADLPGVIDRLKDLQSLHEQASQFSTSLVNMEVAQKRIDENLATYSTQLKSVQDSLANTLAVFKENVQAIEKSMKS